MEPTSDSSPPPPPRKRRRWPWVVLLSVILVPALLLGLWTAIAMTYTYSDGERAGYVQKFSRKGWLCKTWEGEIAMVNIPGAMQERFAFTVRSDSVAEAINRVQGKRVALHYKEHRGVPLSCLGETAYFVDGVRSLDDPLAPAGVPAPAAPPGTPVPTAPRRDTIDPSAGTR